MSPLLWPEINYFIEIIADLRRWAESLDQFIGAHGDQEVGPPWPEADLLELHRAWLEVGNAIRDLTRSQPTADLGEPRAEVLTIRDGIRQIADIHSRQV